MQPPLEIAAEAGDPEAMAALYDIYYYVEDPDEDEAMRWLRRAAEAGNVESINLLGEIARNDEEGYPNDTERLEAAEPWFREAAEEGYAPAMNNLSVVLNQLERHEEAWKWMINASEAGHINGRLWQASCYFQLEEEDNEICQTGKDPAKGWVLREVWPLVLLSSQPMNL